MNGLAAWLPAGVVLAGPLALDVLAGLPLAPPPPGTRLVVILSAAPALPQGTAASCPAALGEAGFAVRITGRADPAALTPPAARRDALLTTGRIIDLADRLARKAGGNASWAADLHAVAASPAGPAPRIAGNAALDVVFFHDRAADLARLAAQFPREAGFIARDSQTSLDCTAPVGLAPLPSEAACLAAASPHAPAHPGALALRRDDASGLPEALPRLFLVLPGAADANAIDAARRAIIAAAQTLS